MNLGHERTFNTSLDVVYFRGVTGVPSDMVRCSIAILLFDYSSAYQQATSAVLASLFG
jgi:hypothetical protein